MTRSPEHRPGDHEIALRTIAADLGDESLSKKSWATSDTRFQTLAATTWVELEERGWIVRARIFGGGLQYHLTGTGWIEGLRLGGAFDDPDYRARCAHLVTVLTHAVDGRLRPNDTPVSLRDLPPALPADWVVNVLKSGLLKEVIPDKRMNAYWDVSTRNIRVPVTFGLPTD